MSRFVPTLLAIFLFVAGVPGCGGRSSDAGKRNDNTTQPSPELRVLEDMVGDWDDVITNKATEWQPKAGRSTSVSKRTWYLGGKFLREEGIHQPGKTGFLSLIGYDSQSKVYRLWYFDAAGTMPRDSVVGTWNEKARTMTFTGADEAGNKAINKLKIVDRDNFEWRLETKNRSGKVVLDISGKCTRRK